MDSDLLLERYLVTVGLPVTGSGFKILPWSTYHARGHVLFANTIKQLRAMFKHVLHNDDLKLSTFFKDVEIVAPPRWLREQYARSRYEDELRQFGYMLEAQLRPLREDPKFKDTEHIKRCIRYKPQYTHEDSDPYLLKRYKKEHRHCKNCYAGMALVGIAVEDLFFRSGSELTQLAKSLDLGFRRFELGPGFRDFSPKSRKTYNPLLTAPIADPDKVLYVLCSSPGDYSDGTQVYIVDKLKDDAPNVVNDLRVLDAFGIWAAQDPLFFFQGTRDLVPSVFTKAIEARKASISKFAKGAKARGEKKRARLAQERLRLSKLWVARLESVL